MILYAQMLFPIQLALGDTELVFNTDIIAEDIDINLQTSDPSRSVFNCTILESVSKVEFIPIYV